MIFIYGSASKEKLNSVDQNLKMVMQAALKTGIMDITIVKGHREKQEQDEYFNTRKSKVEWPNGKHNKFPSEAVDVAPYIKGRASWNKMHCCVLAGIILAVAAMLDIKIRWGGNWDMDSEPITDQDFQDLVHFEIIK